MRWATLTSRTDRTWGLSPDTDQAYGGGALLVVADAIQRGQIAESTDVQDPGEDRDRPW